jgi:hypothetical protein
MSQTPNEPMTAASFLNQQDHRRGAVPTPGGTMPNQRRRRKGMLNLKAWDDHVAATNLANGTESKSAKIDLLQFIQPSATQSAEAALDDAGKRQQETPPEPETPPQAPESIVKPHDPDADDTLEAGQPKAPKMTSGAIFEDTQITQSGNPPVHLPAPSPEGIAAAKLALAEESAAADKIPPPPAAKAAKTPKPAKS